MKLSCIQKFTLWLLFALLGLYTVGYCQINDSRNITTGSIIPDESYSDQPYVVKTDDGAWLCVLTTAQGHEGASGQHIIAQRSFNKGKTWQDQVAIEPSDGPEASYAVLLKAPSGRIFVFYNHNTDNIRSVLGDNPPYKDGLVKRVDSQGYFVFKYSDDGGKTWSSQRYTIPVRAFEIDKKNPYQGRIRFFWNVGKAFSHQGAAYVPLIKVGGFGDGFFTSSEGSLLYSKDLLSIKDPARASWTTLPDGEIGLRTPIGEGGPIAEEQSFTVLSDGSFFCVYRTIDGYSVYTYSRDVGHTWEPPQYMRYADGRLMKHPRAANFVWKCKNGKYLYWFHNHGGRFIKENPERRSMSYNDRNPVWLAGGIETDSPQGKIIKWTQPEILFYDDDPLIRMSYPDLIEDDGAHYITETQKDLARVHRVDEKLLTGLWAQFDNRIKTKTGILLEWKNTKGDSSIKAVDLPDLYQRDQTQLDQSGITTGKGFTIDLSFCLAEYRQGERLLDARDASGKGWLVRLTEKQALELIINDGQTQAVWSCDPNLLQENKEHTVSIIVDGGPKIISFVVDGVLNDGGNMRQFGWGRFSPFLKSANGAHEISIVPNLPGAIKEFTIYDRALTISEAISNFRANMNEEE